MTTLAGQDVAVAAEELYAVGVMVLRRTPRAINLTALSTLTTLERTGPRRVTELAVAQRVAQPSMTSLVKGLQRDGYVERRDDPRDGRAGLVALTEAGAAALRERRRAATAGVAELIASLDEEEAQILAAAVPVLRRLRDLDHGATDRQT